MNQSLSNTGQTTPEQVDCLLIPLRGKQLLLPNVSVAEIIPFSHLLTTASSVDWILGRIHWRGITVPVVCYEMLNNHFAPAPNPNARFAIINGVGGYSSMPFYALLIQGIPKLVHILEKDIQEVESINLGEYDARSVMLGQDSAIIPDLDKIESSVVTII